MTSNVIGRVREASDALVQEHGEEHVALALMTARDRANNVAVRAEKSGDTARAEVARSDAAMLEALSRAFCPEVWK